MLTAGGFYGVLGGLVGSFILFIRFFLWNQIKDLRTDVLALKEHVERMDFENRRQRSIKHDIRNDLTRTLFPLEMVLEATDFPGIERIQPSIRNVVNEVKAHEKERRRIELAVYNDLSPEETVTTTTTTTTGGS